MLRIYVKPEGHKRFQAMDYKAGRPVGNLIYATLWGSEERSHVEGLVAAMQTMNPEMQFEVRTAS